MKWVKHYTDSRRDPVLLAVKREMGFAGVGMFWALVEAIGEQYESGGEPVIDLDYTSWRELTGIPPQSFRKLTENLEKTYRKLGKSSDFSLSFSEKTCKISFQKLKDIKDNYTRDCQATSKQEKEVEEEEDIKLHSTEICDFVDAFNSHVSKTLGKQAPKVTKASREKSLTTVEQLMRLDGYSLEEIRDAMRWAVKDEFWSGNARSLGALRNKSRSNGMLKFQNIYEAWQRSRQAGEDEEDNAITRGLDELRRKGLIK